MVSGMVWSRQHENDRENREMHGSVQQQSHLRMKFLPRLFFSFSIFIAALLCTNETSKAEERIFGTILDEEADTYLVEAEDGTRYKVEWNAGSTLWSVGDEAILTTGSGFGLWFTAPIALHVSIEDN